MAQDKIMNLAAQQHYDEKIKIYIANADATTLKDAKDYADSLEDNYDTAGTAQTKVNELANGQVKANTDAIAKLNGDASTEGSVDKKITDSEAKINEAISNVEKKANATQVDVDALETDMGDIDGLSTNNKTIVGAINEVLTAVGTGGSASVVTVTTDTTTNGALKSYTIKQGTTTVGVIDIPKDMVVESGEVVKNPEGKAEGTYIKLVLANVAEPLYINVGTLVDIYVAKASATQVQVAIDSSTREISAAIVAESIGTTELADSSITTTKIADSNITKAKLSTSIQTSLDKADSAVQEVGEGATNGAITVDGIDVKVHGLGSAAYTDSTAYDEAGSAAGAKSEAVIRAAELDTVLKSELIGEEYTASKDDNTIYGVKKYADYQRATAESYIDEQVEHLEGELSGHEDRLTSLETKIGDGFVAVTIEEIDAMFA